MNKFSKKELSKYEFDTNTPVKKHDDSDIVQVCVENTEKDVKLSIFVDYTHVVLRDEHNGSIMRKRLRTMAGWDKEYKPIKNTLFKYRHQLNNFLPGTYWFIDKNEDDWVDFGDSPIERIQDLSVAEREQVESNIFLNRELGFEDRSDDPEYLNYVTEHLNPRIRFHRVTDFVKDPYVGEFVYLGYVYCPVCGKMYIGTKQYGLFNFACSECGTEMYMDETIAEDHQEEKIIPYNRKYWTNFRTDGGRFYVERYRMFCEYSDFKVGGSVPLPVVTRLQFENSLRIEPGKIVQKENKKPDQKLVDCPVLDMKFTENIQSKSDLFETQEGSFAEKDHIDFDSLLTALDEYGKYTEEEKQKIIKAMNTFPTDYSVFLNPSGH